MALIDVINVLGVIMDFEGIDDSQILCDAKALKSVPVWLKDRNNDIIWIGKTALAFSLNNQRTRVFVSMAQCSPKDTFVKSMGREIAVERNQRERGIDLKIPDRIRKSEKFYPSLRHWLAVKFEDQ